MQKRHLGQKSQSKLGRKRHPPPPPPPTSTTTLTIADHDHHHHRYQQHNTTTPTQHPYHPQHPYHRHPTRSPPTLTTTTTNNSNSTRTQSQRTLNLTPTATLVVNHFTRDDPKCPHCVKATLGTNEPVWAFNAKIRQTSRLKPTPGDQQKKYHSKEF